MLDGWPRNVAGSLSDDGSGPGRVASSAGGEHGSWADCLATPSWRGAVGWQGSRSRAGSVSAGRVRAKARRRLTPWTVAVAAVVAVLAVALALVLVVRHPSDWKARG